jgi:hypothetical protein
MKSSSAKATTGSYSETENDYTKVDAFVVVMSDAVIETANALPPSFLSKLEIPVEKQGGQGPKGADAYTVVINPAYCIFSEEWTEGSSALTVDLRQTISIQVKQKNATKPFKLTYGIHRYCTLDASASTAANTEVSSATLKFGSIATYQSSGQTLYRDQGYLVVNIATVDGNFSQTGIRIPFYLNTKGRFERKIHGDYETAMTEMSEWYPQNTGEPVKHSWLYNELNSAK